MSAKNRSFNVTVWRDIDNMTFGPSIFFFGLNSNFDICLHSKHSLHGRTVIIWKIPRIWQEWTRFVQGCHAKTFLQQDGTPNSIDLYLETMYLLWKSSISFILTSEYDLHPHKIHASLPQVLECHPHCHYKPVLRHHVDHSRYVFSQPLTGLQPFSDFCAVCNKFKIRGAEIKSLYEKNDRRNRSWTHILTLQCLHLALTRGGGSIWARVISNRRNHIYSVPHMIPCFLLIKIFI